MFTGIIQAVGHIERIEQRDEDVRISIASGDLDLSGVANGDSIAVNGCCLTAVDLTRGNQRRNLSLYSDREVA